VPGVSHLTVREAEAGQKLLQFLQNRLGRGLPRTLIMRWVRTGQVRIDGKRSGPFNRLGAGQVVRVPPHDAGEHPGGLSLPSLPIVYEDDALLVVAKPAGVASQPTVKGGDAVSTRIKAMYPDADFPPAITHRLDKDTSGLLLAGKTYAAVRRLGDLFAGREVDKVYLAWVQGKWPEEEPLVLQDRLAKTGQTPRRPMVSSAEGKVALARVRPIAQKEGATLLAVELMTGRTHQIRVQLASRGHPILGDRKYGEGPHRTPLLLHAWRLRLPERGFELAPPWNAEWQPPGDIAERI
jgi:23S rRNA pseudouridine955/2504/2580 synthase